MALRLYTYPNGANAMKALIAAEFSGAAIELPPFEMGVTNKTPDFLKLNPRGKVPTLELPCGRGVFESNAIARYVARVNGGGGAALFGANAREYAATEQWLDFAQNEVGSNVGAWLWPLYGFRAYDAQAEAKAKATLKKALQVVEKVLSKQDFLVGGALTLADIVMCCTLLNAFQSLFDETFRKDIPSITKYFERCAKLPQFRKHMGEVVLCKKTMPKQ